MHSGDIMDRSTIKPRNLTRAAFAACLASALVPWAAPVAAAADDEQALAQHSWRETIVRTEVPEEGCFYASYPSPAWTKVGCTVAPNLPYPPRIATIGQTVGNGVDYAAALTGPMKKNIGSFPKVTGVKSEAGGGVPNDYSLQLNSNFMSTAACPVRGCVTWQQFVYASGFKAAFIQYWEINHGHPCASGWTPFGTGDCYRNSAAVTVPTAQPIKNLAKLLLSGAAVTGGKDTLTLTAESVAYSVTGKDSVVDLATAWHESEFNIVGDGGGSQAIFNRGSSLLVSIEIINGSTTAPTCVAHAGTTAETNNLTLKGCSTFAGTRFFGPSIEFTESN